MIIELLDLKNPHDKFVKKFLSNLESAKDFIKKCFSKSITDQLDFSTLELVNGSYIDGELKESESDLVYRIKRKRDKLNICVYVLIEHKSYIDEEVSFQILKYMTRIWAAELGEQKGKKNRKLSVILPIVMYHGKKQWRIETNFRKFFDLKEKDELEMFIPNFEYLLFDLSKKTKDEVQGEKILQIMLLTLRCLLQREFEEDLKEIMETLRYLPDQNTKIEYSKIVSLYLMATMNKEKKDIFIKEVKTNLKRGEDKIMETIAESIFKEGKTEGKAEGKAEGKTEGKAELLLDMIKEKFKRVPRNISAAINKMTSEELQAFGKKLFVTNNINELVC